MADFFDRAASDPTYWSKVSDGALARVRAAYSWDLYAGRLLTLTSVYSFWKRVSDLDRSEAKRYLEALYVLKLR